jgi:hypothetical protein
MLITFYGFVLNSENMKVICDKIKEMYPLSQDPMEILTSLLLFEDLLNFRKKFTKKRWNINFLKLDVNNYAFYVDISGVVKKEKFGKVSQELSIIPRDKDLQVIKKFHKWIISNLDENLKKDIKLSSYYKIKDETEI